MRVAFAGTPPFAARALGAIHAAGHEIVLVLTQPDRPAGRGMRLTPSAVAESARKLGLDPLKPASLKAAESQAVLRQARPDVLVVAAYGVLLPPAVLEIPARGCINIHASLLPRWRGAAPVQRALLAGDSTTGISIMQMDAGLDTGPVLLTRSIPIAPRETTGSLLERLTVLGALAIVDALASLDELVAQPQDPALATYAHKVGKEDARIDWRRSAAEIDRQVRAFDPAPGAEARLNGEPVKIWKARPVAMNGSPGDVLEAGKRGLVVACGQDALEIVEMQRPGRARVAAMDFVRGMPQLASARFS